MNKLVERGWYIKPAPGPRPYEPYPVKKECGINKVSGFSKLMDLYYPTRRVRIISEHVYDDLPYHYIVQPLGTAERLEVSHWDLEPLDALQETRTFVPAGIALPGVRVRKLDTGEVKMIKDPKTVTTLDDSQMKPSEMVELLAEPKKCLLAESMIRPSLLSEVEFGDTDVGAPRPPARYSAPQKLGRAHKKREAEQEEGGEEDDVGEKLDDIEQAQGQLAKSVKKIARK